MIVRNRPKNRWIRSGLFVSGFLALSAPVFAQEKNAQAVEKQADINVVVTASRGTAQDTLEVPQSIANVTREQIASREYTSVDEILRQEPNISAAPAEGNPNYWQQGFSIRGLGAQRVLTLSDGVRQAGQGIGYGGGNLSLYEPFSIERIEILRGPGSVLYGTDAFGGVINVIRRQPRERESFGVNGGARYVFDGSSNANRFGGYADIGDRDYGLIIGGSYINSDRPNLPDDLQANSGSFRNWSGWSRFNYRIDDDTRVRVMGDMNRTMDVLVIDSVLPLPIAMAPAAGSQQLVVSPLNFSIPKYQRSLVGTEIEFENLAGGWDTFKTGVYWQQLRRQFTRISPYYSLGSPGFAGPPLFVNPAATVTQSRVNTDDTVNMIEWQNQARYIDGAHTFTFGLDLGYDTTELPEIETQTVLARAGLGRAGGGAVSVNERIRADASQFRTGAYVQDSIEAGRFTFVPGARLDYFSVNDDLTSFDDDEFGASASLGTLAKLTERDSAYVNLATGYRAPDLGERFQNGVVNLGAPTRIVGKADLDSERAYNAEVGVKGRHSDFDYEVASFFNHVRDYIGARALGVVQGFFTEQYDNLGNVNLYGVEGRTSYDLSKQVSLFVTTGRTYTNASEKIDVPNWSWRYGATYRTNMNMQYAKEFSATLYARTVADSTDNTVSPGKSTFPSDQGFTTLNLEMTLGLGQTMFGEGTLVGGVRNIFDEKYREPFFNEYQPGLNGYVGVQFDF